MFTGIIEEVGTVRAIRRGGTEARITIACRRVLGKSGSMSSDPSGGAPTRIGDSIAVNGVCLTVTELGSGTFTADVMPETFSRSSLAALRPGVRVNLERAMPADGRFGGHIVTGHIDGTGTITKRTRDGNAIWFTVTAADELIRYIVQKGSIAIDGISLTVAEVGESWFSISAIPHTVAVTTLGEKRPGDTVNLENDVIGKYVEKLLRPQPQETAKSSLTLEFLAQHGF